MQIILTTKLKASSKTIFAEITRFFISHNKINFTQMFKGISWLLRFVNNNYEDVKEFYNVC